MLLIWGRWSSLTAELGPGGKGSFLSLRVGRGDEHSRSILMNRAVNRLTCFCGNGLADDEISNSIHQRCQMDVARERLRRQWSSFRCAFTDCSLVACNTLPLLISGSNGTSPKFLVICDDHEGRSHARRGEQHSEL